MIYFTKQERTVLCVLVFVVFLGALAQYVFKKYPEICNIVNLLEAEEIYPKTSVNAASFEELIAIPFIGQYTADKILQYRRENGEITTLEQVRMLPGIRKRSFEVFSKYLKL